MISQNSGITKNRTPWSWIPTLYFAEGLPYFIVTVLSVIMYERLGLSNAEIGFYTSWLYLPWVIKLFWSPVVDVFKTKRFWILAMQLLIGAGLAGIAFTIPMPDFFQFTYALLWLIAFSSATHNISADGFYMLALPESRQSFFIGIRTSSYRIAIIAGQSLIILLAGFLESTMTLAPVEFKVVANPGKFFEETIKVDSSSAKQLPGNLRLIANPNYIEISTRPQTKVSVNFYKNFAHNFNIMNGFTKEEIAFPDTSNQNDLVGNIGIAKYFLSKRPADGEEFIVKIDFVEGDSRIKIIEGRKIIFTSNNWNKPALTVFQLDSTLTKRAESIYKAQINKVPLAWSITLSAAGILFLVFFIYHKIILPRPENDQTVGIQRHTTMGKEFFRSFARFFEKKNIILIILFLIFYRLGESQLEKIAAPFLLDDKNLGGLGLSTYEAGLGYGTLGAIAMLMGGIIGGFAIMKKGLKFWLRPMLFIMYLPNAVYVYLAYTQPVNIWIIYSCTAFQQFCFGFGFTFALMYMIYLSEGEYKTSHFAIASGFMTLGMMLIGLVSGIIQDAIGYKLFFVWLVVSIIPSLIIVRFIPVEYQFGKKKLLE